MRGGSRDRLPWHRRLSLRLAGLLALTLVAFDFLAPHVYDLVFGFFGVPARGVSVALSEGESVGDRGVLSLPLHREPATIADLLLEGAVADAEGRRHPSEAAIERVGEELASTDEGFLWLDRDLMVVAASEDLPWSVGQRWDPSAREPGPGAPPRGHHQHPVIGDDLLEGWLVLLFRAPEAFATFGPTLEGAASWLHGEAEGAEYEVPEEVQRVARRMEWLARVVSWSMTFLVAVLLSVAVSRLVTVRIARLAAMVGRPVQDETDPPCPFAVGGADEIAMLARALEDSRNRVAELLRDLAQRDVRRREWIAQVSHDLRTPLTALIACLERARPVVDRLAEEEPRGELTGILSVALQDAERVGVLAGDLLEIARLDAHAELNVEPVLPAELVERGTRSMAPLGETRGVALRAVAPPNLPPVLADGSRLLRVLENLLRNALSSARELVVVEVREDRDALRFEVRDDGRGFPGGIGPVDLGELSPARAPGDSSSTGLGLTVATRIVEAHGGRIGADNPRGGGATVWFTIPVAAEAEA